MVIKCSKYLYTFRNLVINDFKTYFNIALLDVVRQLNQKACTQGTKTMLWFHMISTKFYCRALKIKTEKNNLGHPGTMQSTRKQKINLYMNLFKLSSELYNMGTYRANLERKFISASDSI